MSTQYDNIGTQYNYLKTLPIAKLERINVRDAIAPYVKGAKVLDLACGTGYYTRALLEWGAEEVVGMDISSEMVKAAKAEAQKVALAEKQKFSFAVGDVSEPFKLDSGPFDLVLGVWLLNYAPDHEVMARMWKNIANHLRPGGVFVGVVPPPESGMETLRNSTIYHQGPKNGVTLDIIGEVPNGLKTRFTIEWGSGNFFFENYHLEKEVYETSAREGGMEGAFRWRPMQLPQSEEEIKQLDAQLETGFLNRYFMGSAHCGMCVVER
jgi:SAM-dependent methyltransferase